MQVILKQTIKFKAMETNTVNLNLRTYNRLRDFEKNIKENNSISLNSYNSDNEYRNYWYYTQSEMVKMIGKENNILMDKINDLERQLAGEPKEMTLRDVRKMSIWQFIKWRRK